MKTTIITADDIGKLVTRVGLDKLMDQMILRLQDACESFDATQTVVLARDGFHYEHPNTGLLEWMPAMRHGAHTTIKMVGYHPSNPDRGLPTILSTIGAYDVATGHLTGIADATFLTALRTGAASAVASRVLAKPDSRVLGLVGCGAQSVTQAHALGRLFPIRRILIQDTDESAMASFADRLAGFMTDVPVVERAPLPSLLRDSDIVCTATSIDVGKGPLFEYVGDNRAWLHINAVGSDFPGKLELPANLLASALVAPDYLEQAVKEGECQQVPADRIGPDLATLVARAREYVDARSTLTVFDSTGWALEDQVAMEMLLEYAAELGLGEQIQLETIGGDPRNPYAFGQSALEPAWNRQRARR